MFLRTIKTFCRPVGLFLAVLLLPLSALAQSTAAGSVAGVIVSTWNATPLAGVTVSVRGTTLATQADANGRFELKGVPTGDQVLRFSKSGYASATVTEVRVLPDQTTTVNGNLRPEFYDLEEYEVTAEEFTDQTEKIMLEREKSSAMLDAIGSQQFSKMGVNDAAGALGKVTGASVADGKFAVVRGLPDRYTSTTMNGGDIPSADPNRRAVQLDLLPAQFIDQLNVAKTFTPDMPGGFSGGAIDIVTKTFPDEPMASFSAGMSYNTQASLRDDFLMSDHSSTDWLAMDDGKRALPRSAAATSPLGTSSQLDPAIKTSFGSSQFAPVFGESSVNSSFSLAFGSSRELKRFPGHKIGFLAGMYYKQDYSYYDDGVIEKFDAGGGKVDQKKDARALINYAWGAMGSLGYELADAHQLTYTFMRVSTAEDEARRAVGQDYSVGTELGTSYLDQNILRWTERTLTTHQLRGIHTFKDLGGVEFSWVGSLATTTQDEPDYRIFQTFVQPGDPNDPDDDSYSANGATKPSRPTRIWRYLSEDNSFFRGDLKVPVPSYNDGDNYLKAGGFISNSEREYNSRAFDVRTFRNHPFQQYGDPNSYLADENLGNIQYFNFPGNYVYQGKQVIDGFYGMAEWSVLNWLKVNGGARIERTELSVVADNLATAEAPTNSAINKVDVLPAVGVIITLRSNLLLRGSWSQTVVRPTYREISFAELYDTAQGRVYQGNPNLRMSSSENFDARIEWYPSPGDLVSLSVFKKYIKDPIEQASQDVNNEFIYYENFGEAEVQGVEFEIRKSLAGMPRIIRDFNLGFNFTYIQSEVARTELQYYNQNLLVYGPYGQTTTMTRPMYEQPEYIMNADITWDHKETGTAITVSGGIVGKRLTLVGLGTPDEYEQASPQFDVFFSQNLGKHWKMKFSAKNLLNPAFETTQEWPTTNVKVRSYTKGITYGLTLGCEF